MKQSQIIHRLLLPPRQDAAEAIHPTVRSFHNPASGFEASLSFDGLGFFATSLDVSGVPKLLYQITHRIVIISLVKAHALWLCLRRLWTLDRNTVNRRLNHLAIMSVGAVDRQADRHAGCFSQQAPLNAFFGPIRRVWAGFFPRLAGLWSSHRPLTATTSQFPSVHRTPQGPWPTVSQRCPPLSIPGIDHEPCCWGRCPSHSTRSIDNRSATQRRWHPYMSDRKFVGDRRRNGAWSYAWATAAQSRSRVHQILDTDCFVYVFSSLISFQGVRALLHISDDQGLFG